MKTIVKIGIVLFALCACLLWARQHKAKPLAGYTDILVEPFTVERKHARDFPLGQEAELTRSALAALEASAMFRTVGGSSSSPARPDTVTLSGVVIRFNPGSSVARFMMWPLPAGASTATARFAFRDSVSNREVLVFEKEFAFQALASGGFSTKEKQMSHIKQGLAEGLVKEIKRNR